MNLTNESLLVPSALPLTGGNRNTRITSHDDATWILTSAFIVFTMQSGFGLLESGSVTSKNEVNVMMKNVVDVLFGGLTYWMVGYGLSFGEKEPYSNPFCGWGHFFVHANENELGWLYSKFFFQASFATTATTIVSGAMAERIKMEAYIVFSFFNTLVISFPVHWIWGQNGWLRELGVIDIAGAGPIHLVGGTTGLIATLMLRPRCGRYTKKDPPEMSSPTNTLLGMFMLWWGWLGFSCGSTFGISGLKWKLAARSAVATILSSIAGGIVGMFISYVVNKKMFLVQYLTNGVLGSLVAITGMCALAQPWESFVVGAVGAVVSLAGMSLFDKLKIDDPVGCISVHGLSGIWGLLAVGLFTGKDSLRGAIRVQQEQHGIFYGGSCYLLGVQSLAIVVLIVWSSGVSFLLLKAIDKVIGLRVSPREEFLGADIAKHGIKHNHGAMFWRRNKEEDKPNQNQKGISKWKRIIRNKRFAFSKSSDPENMKISNGSVSNKTARNGSCKENGDGTRQRRSNPRNKCETFSERANQKCSTCHCDIVFCVCEKMNSSPQTNIHVHTIVNNIEETVGLTNNCQVVTSGGQLSSNCSNFNQNSLQQNNNLPLETNWSEQLSYIDEVED